MNRLSSFFLITRPLNVIIAGISILLAALLVETNLHCVAVWCAVTAGMLITAGANVINDIYDLEIDRINKPERMLPAGRISLHAARGCSIILLAAGVIFSIFAGLFAALLALISTFLVVTYSRSLKRRPLIGNLIVSLVTALAFIFGAVAACAETLRWQAGLFPALFAFFMHLGREIVKDIEDQVGDKAEQARTLPLAYGQRAAQSAATLAFAALMIVTLIPALIGFYQQPYWWLIVLGVYPVLAFATWQVWRDPSAKQMRFVSNLLKADMLLGLAAIWFGAQR